MPGHATASGHDVGRWAGLVALAVTIIGTVMASFTNVSLLSGSGTVWTGAAIAAVGAIASLLVPRARVAVRVVACVLAVLALGSAVYDEVQLQHRRDELKSLFGSMPAPRLVVRGTTRPR